MLSLGSSGAQMNFSSLLVLLSIREAFFLLFNIFIKEYRLKGWLMDVRIVSHERILTHPGTGEVYLKFVCILSFNLGFAQNPLIQLCV